MVVARGNGEIEESICGRAGHQRRWRSTGARTGMRQCQPHIAKGTMEDLGVDKKILGMETKRDKNSRVLLLSQQNYIKKLLHHFNMHDAQSVIICHGSLLF